MLVSEGEDASVQRMTDLKPMPSWGPARQQQQQSNRPKPPFKLCFAAAEEMGRSEFSRPRLYGRTMALITPKFYSVHDALTNDEDAEVQAIEDEMKKLQEVGPREKYQEPLLESHKYGWFQEKLFDVGRDQDNFYFPIRTSEMVRIQSILDNASKAEKQFQQFQQAAHSRTK